MSTDTDTAPARLDNDALRRVAEAATPGPWRMASTGIFAATVIVGPADDPEIIHDKGVNGPDDYKTGGPVATANYIATFDPPTILAMLDELDDLRATFDMHWAADQRAIKCWQESTGRATTWPDRTDMVVWLLDDLERARATHDMLCDSHYVAGMKAGWNFAVAGDDDGYQKTVNCRKGHRKEPPHDTD